MSFQFNHQWAVILGGSSGFGLATAKKLASEGMKLIIVHRDRRGAMKNIQPQFDKLSEQTELVAFNCDALADDVQDDVIGQIKDKLGNDKVRLLMHSIAFGNLKLIAQPPASNGNGASGDAQVISKLAGALSIAEDTVRSAVNSLFDEGVSEFHSLADTPDYGENIIEEEDMQNTIYAMGSSMLTWARKLLAAGLFDQSARVIGLTSEGNEVAWKGYAAVSAAKATLEACARSMAVEMAPYGVRTNILQPGVTDTPALRLIPGSRHISAKATLRNPFKRLTTPEDVAGAVYLLCRPEGDWINGDIIRVDGGEHISG